MTYRRRLKILFLSLALAIAACTNDTPVSTVVTAPAQPATDTPATNIALEEVATFEQPMAILNRQGDNRLFVLERAGTVVPIDPQNGKASRAIIDISNEVATEGERGLIGGAFSPDGKTLYLHWSDEDGATRLDEWTMNGDSADTTSRRSLLLVDQPFANHNGGQVAIGPDGYLYLALGDGGSANDPLGSGQDTATLLGSILRIDPNGGTGDESYAIPPDNPFVAGGGAAEIFLWGVRNPWRFSFDRETGDLWVADVGQDKLEEVTVLRAADGGGLGTNLGWNLREGSAPFTGDEPADHVGPFYEYGHQDDNCSITGGYVYRGSAIPSLIGSYIYSDYCVGEVVAVDPDGTATPLGLTVPGRQVVTFGEDNQGELFVASAEGQLVALRAV